MPRRYASYGANEGFTTLNQVSSVGAFILGLSTLPFFYNVYKSRRSPRVGVDDPWGWGRSLEWATSCPPPRHNFEKLPRIRSDSPAFDANHPELVTTNPAQNLLTPDD
jgi:cytochrome c oxidase subunit 1